MNKTTIQNNEYARLKDSKRVILKWATGVGKSKMTIDLVNNAVHTLHPHKEVVTMLLVVAERAHKKNWEEEFTKWHLESRGMDIKIICYNSLHKERDMDYDIIIFDEAHHSFTEKRMAILETLKGEYIYLLSATLSAQKVYDIEAVFGKFTVSTVSLKKAIEQDILPDPKVYVMEMELDNTKYNHKITIGNAKNPPVIKWEERAKYIYKNIPCIIECTQKQKYQYLTEKMEYWKRRYERSKNIFHQNKWVNLGSIRKRFLGELKTDAIKNLTSKFPSNKRYICFCASVAQAELLDITHTISSKRASKLNQLIIDNFNAKKLNRLYAVGMANEGLNLTDIEVGIITQLDGKERLFIQKMGRVCRAERPIVYIFYYKDTQDEKYLKYAIENIDEKYIKHLKYENSI